MSFRGACREKERQTTCHRVVLAPHESAELLAGGSRRFYVKILHKSLWAFYSLASENFEEEKQVAVFGFFCFSSAVWGFTQSVNDSTWLKNWVLTGKYASYQSQMLSRLSVETICPVKETNRAHLLACRSTFLGPEAFFYLCGALRLMLEGSARHRNSRGHLSSSFLGWVACFRKRRAVGQNKSVPEAAK